MAAHKAAARTVALFVEGVNSLTPQGRDDLRELWRYQCSRLSRFPPALVDVYGFSKKQLVDMAPARQGQPPGQQSVQLDVFIERKFKAKPFDTLLVAFDAQPANNAVTPVPGAPCLQLEKDFVLERFAASTFLPHPFRTVAASLLAHYRANRGRPRTGARPPIGEVELIYMDPNFEALVLQDALALRAVFGLKKTPTTWPALPFSGNRPDFAFRKIVQAHRRSGPNCLRVGYDARKHAWAQEVFRNAANTSRIWQHATAVRLSKVLS